MRCTGCFKEGNKRGGYMSDTSKVIYSINIDDVQTVAREEFGRKLNARELQIVENKIGDYIDWYEAILETIKQNISV